LNNSLQDLFNDSMKGKSIWHIQSPVSNVQLSVKIQISSTNKSWWNRYMEDVKTKYT